MYKWNSQSNDYFLKLKTEYMYNNKTWLQISIALGKSRYPHALKGKEYLPPISLSRVFFLKYLNI